MEEDRKLWQVARTSKDPVRLRRAIVVLMSGQGREVRDIASLLQVALGASITAMTDGLGPWAVIAAVARGIAAVATNRAGRPKLKVTVAGARESNGALFIWVRATNEGGAAITIDTVSSFVKGKAYRDIESVDFSSGPKLPFRLDSYSSAEWTSTVKVRDQWMAARNVVCTAYISGGGMDAYRERKVPDH